MMTQRERGAPGAAALNNATAVNEQTVLIRKLQSLQSFSQHNHGQTNQCVLLIIFDYKLSPEPTLLTHIVELQCSGKVGKSQD